MSAGFLCWRTENKPPLKVPKNQPRPPDTPSCAIQCPKDGERPALTLGLVDNQQVPLPLAEGLGDGHHKGCLGKCREEGEESVECDAYRHLGEGTAIVHGENCDDDLDIVRKQLDFLTKV